MALFPEDDEAGSNGDLRVPTVRRACRKVETIVLDRRWGSLLRASPRQPAISSVINSRHRPAVAWRKQAVPEPAGGWGRVAVQAEDATASEIQHDVSLEEMGCRGGVQRIKAKVRRASCRKGLHLNCRALEGGCNATQAPRPRPAKQVGGIQSLIEDSRK